MREKPRRQRHERGVKGCSAGIGRCSRRRCSSEKCSVARRGRRSDGGGMRRAAIVQFFVETTVYEEMKQGIVSRRYAAAQVRFDSTGRWTHQAFSKVEKVLRIDRHLTVTSPDLVFKRGPQPDIRPTADMMAVQSLSHLRGQLGGRPPELCFGDGLFVCKYVYPDRRRPVRIAGQLVIPVHHPWREVDTSERRLHPLSLVRHRQVGCQDFKYSCEGYAGVAKLFPRGWFVGRHLCCHSAKALHGRLQFRLTDRAQLR